MAVFELFAKERRELSNSDMARLLSVPESSSSDLLHTLHMLGYLMRTPLTRRFYPTGRLFEAARQISSNDPLTAAAQETVEEVARKTGETTYLGIRERSVARIVATVPSRHALRYTAEVGERYGLHSSAFGKALLGFMPREDMLADVSQLNLKRVTPRTLDTVDAVVANIDLGRERGWYQTRGESGVGVCALAVSGCLSGRVVGLSVAGPTERMEENHDAYLAVLLEVRDVLLTHEPFPAPKASRPDRAAPRPRERRKTLS
ncbi:IclR family transcriptional regulator [Cupriavidus necator H16]|nr:IclR family transcriptional regulator [Cupriavidus necator H16]QQB81097.1 IclR family transcriptional regulator [Cupriavidus necator]